MRQNVKHRCKATVLWRSCCCCRPHFLTSLMASDETHDNTASSALKVLKANKSKVTLNHLQYYSIFNQPWPACFMVWYSHHLQFQKIMVINSLYNSSDFKETFKVENLSQRHGNKHKGFKEGPPNYAAVCAIIDCSVDSFSNFHILLFMFDTS